MFRLTRKQGATVGMLACEKQKDGPDGWESAFRFEMVTLKGSDAGGTSGASDDLGAGFDLEAGHSSLVVDRIETGVRTASDGTGVGAGGINPTSTAALLDAVDRAWKEGAPWSLKTQAGERCYIRRMVADMGFSAADAEQLMRFLVAAGQIEEAVTSTTTKKKGLRLGRNRSGETGQNVFD